MAGSAGQAAGLAVGAAVGSFVGNPVSGAALGSAVGGYFDQTGASKEQAKLEREVLKLNQAQFHNKAAAQGAIHAANFRQSLAHQVSLAGMRGGSGSLATQFGSQAYKTFLEDQQAIEAGLKVSDAQTALSGADITARQSARDTLSFGNAAVSAFDGFNLNAPRAKKG